ncbi:MAG: hypothetical protein V3W28_06105 [Thermoplasmata archaeon]
MGSHASSLYAELRMRQTEHPDCHHNGVGLMGKPKDFRWRCGKCDEEKEVSSPKAATKGLAKHIKRSHPE